MSENIVLEEWLYHTVYTEKHSSKVDLHAIAKFNSRED